VEEPPSSRPDSNPGAFVCGACVGVIQNSPGSIDIPIRPRAALCSSRVFLVGCWPDFHPTEERRKRGRSSRCPLAVTVETKLSSYKSLIDTHHPDRNSDVRKRRRYPRNGSCRCDQKLYTEEPGDLEGKAKKNCLIAKDRYLIDLSDAPTFPLDRLAIRHVRKPLAFSLYSRSSIPVWTERKYSRHSRSFRAGCQRFADWFHRRSRPERRASRANLRI